MSEIYVTKVEIIDGELIMLFPPEFLKKLDLKHNEFLAWEYEEDKITIRKKVNTTNDQ